MFYLSLRLLRWLRFRHIIPYEFKKKYCWFCIKTYYRAYGEGTLLKQTCLKWLQDFEINFSASWDECRAKRPTSFVENFIQNMVAKHSQQTNNTEIKYLKKMCLINQYGAWVQQICTNKNLLNRISTCGFLLGRRKEVQFHHRFVTEDEK